MDNYEYPTDVELDTIREWDILNYGAEALMDYVKERWWASTWGWHQNQRRLYLSTGGWSGNESIMDALSHNFIFWTQVWLQENRGGHYILDRTAIHRIDRMMREKHARPTQANP